MPPTRSQKSRSTGAMLDRRFRPACKEKIEKFIETELAKQMRRLASVHKYLRIRDLCKEMAFGSQHAGGECRSSYNSFEFNVLSRQFLESVHKYLRIRDLCKELAFGSQHAGGECRSSYNSFEFNVLCRQFLESMVPVFWR